MQGKCATTKDHYERINEVLAYINNHLDEKMDLGHLAGISNYSQYHFHRIMRAHLGESIGSYIIRIRLDAAATMLKHSPQAIHDIAYKIGYDTPSSFNKAFKKRFDISPKKFRENTKSQILADGKFIKTEVMETMDLKPKIKTLKEKTVIYVTAIGQYGDENTKKAWETVANYAKKNRLFGFKTEFIGISFDDPSITTSEKCRHDACITISKDVKPEGIIGVKTISAGKFAIFRLKGPYSNLGNAYNYIYNSWLIQNQISLRNVPGYEKYLSHPEKTKPEKFITEIYIPIN